MSQTDIFAQQDVAPLTETQHYQTLAPGPPRLLTTDTSSPLALAPATFLVPRAPSPPPPLHQVVTTVSQEAQGVLSSDLTLALTQLQGPQEQEVVLGQEQESRVDRWKCGNCGLEFTDLASMKTHLETHLGQYQDQEPAVIESHKCDNCGDTFSTSEELASHSLTHQTSSFSCDQCEAKFPTTAALEKHQTSAHQERPFRCGHSSCGEAFRTVGGLTRHNQGVHGGDPGQGAAQRRKPGAHIKLSEEQTKALAETPVELAKTISEKLLLSSAAEKVRSERSEARLVERESHAHQCDQCEVSFKKPSDLVRHVRTHTGERPYACDKCDKRFTVKSTLRTHMKVHTGGKTLVCHVCQSLFASRTSLKVHMRLHTGSLPYKCAECGLRFRTPAHRKTHVTNHCGKGRGDKKGEELIPLTISAESLTAALEAVSSSGAPLVGATVQLQLHGQGFESALTQLQIDEALLAQLRKGENINISISRAQLNQGKKTDQKEQKVVQEVLQTTLAAEQNLEEEGEENLDLLDHEPELLGEQEEEHLLSDQVILLPGPEELSYSVQTDDSGTILGIQPGETKARLGADLLQPLDISQVYICPWCDRVFNSEKDRICHLLTGHGVEVKEDGAVPEVAAEEDQQGKEKVCGVCEKKFAKPSQLVRHLRVHTGERPFACLVCRKSFNQKNALQIHMKKHTGERPYVCPFCQYAFTQKGNLKTHIQRSHAESAHQLVQKSLTDQVIIKFNCKKLLKI